MYAYVLCFLLSLCVALKIHSFIAIESCGSVTSHLTNALLLNTQHYSFLFSRETQLEPGVVGGTHC